MARAGGMEFDERASVAENARRELPHMVSAYFFQVREALAGRPTPGELHRVRLASKRLRYTLELFRPCYPAGLEERLEALKKLQDFLGEVNDAVASARLLRAALKRHPEVRQFLKERAAEKAAGFARHWEETFDATGQEAWWTGFLARSVRSPRKSRPHSPHRPAA
jgi:CHAD domain-containing protein